MAINDIGPVFDRQAKILILGSFPSVKSREAGFFYSHPQNRFWRVLSALLNEATPCSIPEKRGLLLRNGIALWDVVASCEIVGSSDSSIRNVRANDIEGLVAATGVLRIFTNGATAHRLYRRYSYPLVGIADTVLPSTSSANASLDLISLCQRWRVILEP